MMIASSSPTSTTPRDVAELQHRAVWKAGAIGALNVFTAILSLRLVVLVSIVGGIGLTWLCLQSPDPYRIGALFIYCGFVQCPVVWLASRKG